MTQADRSDVTAQAAGDLLKAFADICDAREISTGEAFIIFGSLIGVVIGDIADDAEVATCIEMVTSQIHESAANQKARRRLRAANPAGSA